MLAYDLAINGKGRLSQSLQSGTNTAATYIDEYDASGRPRVQRQRFETNGVWSNSYQVSRNYNLGGNVNSQTYPSGHTVNYTYDGAGRTLTFTGIFGDGTSRTYANGSATANLVACGRSSSALLRPYITKCITTFVASCMT